MNFNAFLNYDPEKILAYSYLEYFNDFYHIVSVPFVLTRVKSAQNITYTTDPKMGLVTDNLNTNLPNWIATFRPEFERRFSEDYSRISGSIEDNKRKYERLNNRYISNQIEFANNCELAMISDSVDKRALLNNLTLQNRRLYNENAEIWQAGEELKEDTRKLLLLLQKFEYIFNNMWNFKANIYYNNQPKNKKIVIELIF